MRSSSATALMLTAALAAGAALVAQGPPPATATQQPAAAAEGRGRGQGRGGAPRVDIKENEECPPGMVEVRNNSCQAPLTPPPSIVDYRPRSTVVAEQHL